MSVPVNIAPGTLPFDCYPTPQQLNEAIINGAVAEVDAAFTPVIKSEVEPGVDQRDYIWFSLVDLEYYIYVNGDWVRKHSTPASGAERRLWTGTEADLWSYDGGDGSDPGVVAPVGAVGAMWEVDTSFAAKFIIAPGTLPGGTVLAVGATGGVEEVTLSEAQGAVGQHTHPVGLFNQSGSGNADDAYFNKVGPVAVPSYGGRYITGGGGISSATLTQADIYTLKASDGAGVTAVPHTNMPPYRAAFVIKRTARTLIVA
jgi:hypothetical protein